MGHTEIYIMHLDCYRCQIYKFTMNGNSLDKENNRLVHYFGKKPYWKRTNQKTQKTKKYYSGSWKHTMWQLMDGMVQIMFGISVNKPAAYTASQSVG